MPILRYNPVLANLSVLLVIALGLLSYFTLPREENPTVNFNWVEVTTLYPGASAGEIEQKVTRPLELSAAGVADIEFILSTSRESISSILVRFEADLDKAVFGKRLADLRRAIDRERANLPATAEANPETTEMGWEVYPEGMYEMLAQVHFGYGFPAIYITENGAAYRDERDSEGMIEDAARIAYLRRHLEKPQDAISPWRTGPRVFRLVAARQLRMGIRHLKALWVDPRGS